jgi:hypothetical protein
MSRLDHWLTNDFDGEDEAARAEAIEEKVGELLDDRDAVLEADSWMEGTLDYDGIETAAADLWDLEPGQIFSSDAWRHLLTFAQQAHKARMAKLEEMAEKAVDEAAAFRPDMDDAA